jgi:hypothetical protein
LQVSIERHDNKPLPKRFGYSADEAVEDNGTQRAVELTQSLVTAQSTQLTNSPISPKSQMKIRPKPDHLTHPQKPRQR